MSISTYSLISLDSVKDFIGLKGANTDSDGILEDLIDRVSAMFESYCDRSFLSREYTEYYDGLGAAKLYTNQYPITTVSGIWQDRDWTWGSTTEVGSSYYRVSNDTRYVVFKDTTLYNYEQNVKVIYTAGYTTTPYDITGACVKEVARSYKNKNQVDISSKSLADGSVSYVVTDFLPDTLTILNKYKRISIA